MSIAKCLTISILLGVAVAAFADQPTLKFDQYMTSRPSAATPVSQADKILINQGGVTKQAPVSALTVVSGTTAFVGSGGYANISTAKAAIGSATATLQYNTAQSVNTLNIPANIELMPMNGAVITVASGKTLTINSSSSRWPAQRLFAGSGSVTGLSGEVNVLWFGADPSGVADSLNAVNSAINSFSQATGASTNYAVAGVVLFPGGNYYLSNTLNIERQVILRGTGSPAGNAIGNTWLYFANTAQYGIVGRPFNDSVSGKDAAGTLIENMSIAQKPGGTAGIAGVWMRTRMKVRSCMVTCWHGNGIQIVANAGGTPGVNLGNANGWWVEDVVLLLNGGDGMYVAGGDANAGTAIGVDAEANGGWGIRDASFLGNHYTTPQAAGNGLGAFTSIGSTNQSTFVGAYSEGGQPSSTFGSSTVIVGGTHGAGVTGGLYITPNSGGTYTPALALGGASTGMTYGVRQGAYDHVQYRCTFTAYMALSAVGSSTGNLTVTLPFATANSSQQYVTFPVIVDGMTGISGAVMAMAAPNSNTATLYNIGTGSKTALTQANLTNASSVVISGVYLTN